MKPSTTIPSYPLTVRIAGIFWLIMGVLLGILFLAVSFTLLFMTAAEKLRHEEVIAISVGLFSVLAMSVILFINGIGCIRGTSEGVTCKGILSIVFGAILPFVNPQSTTDVVVSSLVGLSFIAAGVATLIARHRYKTWREAHLGQPH